MDRDGPGYRCTRSTRQNAQIRRRKARGVVHEIRIVLRSRSRALDPPANLGGSAVRRRHNQVDAKLHGRIASASIVRSRMEGHQEVALASRRKSSLTKARAGRGIQDKCLGLGWPCVQAMVAQDRRDGA